MVWSIRDLHTEGRVKRLSSVLHLLILVLMEAIRFSSPSILSYVNQKTKFGIKVNATFVGPDCERDSYENISVVIEFSLACVHSHTYRYRYGTLQHIQRAA